VVHILPINFLNFFFFIPVIDNYFYVGNILIHSTDHFKNPGNGVLPGILLPCESEEDVFTFDEGAFRAQMEACTW